MCVWRNAQNSRCGRPLSISLHNRPIPQLRSGGRESESSAERRGEKNTHAYYYYMRTDRHLSGGIFWGEKKTDAKGSPDRETLPSEKYISEQDLVARLPLSSVECGGLLRQQVALRRIGKKRRRGRQFGGEKGGSFRSRKGRDAKTRRGCATTDCSKAGKKNRGKSGGRALLAVVRRQKKRLKKSHLLQQPNHHRLFLIHL